MPNHRKFKLHDGRTGAAIAVRVVPGAETNRISEVLDDGMLVIHLQGKAGASHLNETLLSFLAEKFEIPQKSIEIIAGKEGNEKLITLMDITSERIQNIVTESR